MEALKADAVFSEALGRPFMEFIAAYKQSEIDAYLASVTGPDGVAPSNGCSVVLMPNEAICALM